MAEGPRTAAKRRAAILTAALALLAGCSQGSDLAATEPTSAGFSIPSELTLPGAGSIPSNPIDPPALPLSALPLLAQFGDDSITGTVESADRTLRLVAPDEGSSPSVTAAVARLAVPKGLIPHREAASALLAVLAGDRRLLVWVIGQGGVEVPTEGFAGESGADAARRQAVGPGAALVVALVDATSGAYLEAHYVQ